jgi:hypothetical protein
MLRSAARDAGPVAETARAKVEGRAVGLVMGKKRLVNPDQIARGAQ